MLSAADEQDLARPGRRTVLGRFALAAALVAADLWSKAAVFAWLSDPDADLVRDVHGHLRHHVLGPDVGWLCFMLSKNAGAAFGRFSEFPHLLVGGRVVAALFLAWLLVRTPRTRRWFSLALVLVLAGALGNLYDNLFLHDAATDHPYGEVRDFIDVYFAWIGEAGWHFPTFNVADSGITVGAVLLFLTSFSKDEPAEAPDDAPAEAEQPTEEATAVAQDLLTK